VSAQDLQRLADERGVTMEEIAAALHVLPPALTSALSSGEADVLRTLGVVPTEQTRSPVIAGVLLRHQLEATSLTTEEAAELLGRDGSRVRQRLAGPNRSLLGFHRRSGQREWALPRFQFELGLHDLDGWGRLLRALPQADTTSPVALVAWLTSPQPHLGDRSRAGGLAAGVDVDTLIAEAAAFGIAA
jgi:plasmid maintenance system antidote protein VapI